MVERYEITGTILEKTGISDRRTFVRWEDYRKSQDTIDRLSARIAALEAQLATKVHSAQKVNTARRNGSARKNFVERVGELLEEYEQGRGATACLADIKKAYAKVNKIKVK